MNGFGVHATRSAATGLLPEIIEHADFLVLDGGKRGATDREFRHVLGSRTVIVDRYGKPATHATTNSPLDVDNEGKLFSLGIEDFASVSAGEGMCIIPSGFLQAGDRLALKALHKEILSADFGPNTALRLPLHTEWLAGKDRHLLIAVLNDLPIRTAVLPGGNPRDPLSTFRSVCGLIAITQAVEGLSIWGTDLAGLGAHVFGLKGWALGMGNAQRHTLAPGQGGRRNGNSDTRPSRLVEELHRWRTARNLDDSTTLYTCEPCCNGDPLKALTPDETRRHNLLTAMRMFDAAAVGSPSERITRYYEVLVRARSMQQAEPDIKQVDAQLSAWIRAIERPFWDEVGLASA